MRGASFHVRLCYGVRRALRDPTCGAAVVPHSGAHLSCSLCCCVFRNILESNMSELMVFDVTTPESLDTFLISVTVRPGRWVWMSTHREKTLCIARKGGGGGIGRLFRIPNNILCRTSSSKPRETKLQARGKETRRLAFSPRLL